MIGGKGCGKSSFAPLWLDREIRKNPSGKFILCAPSNKILQQGVLPEWLTHCKHSDLKGQHKEWKGIYELPTGGVVFLRSLDDPECINGIHASAIVVDEGGYIPLNAWHIIESRVAKNMGRVLITTSPYRKYRWLERDFISRFKSNDPSYFVVQCPSKVNPSFSQQEYERQRLVLPAWKFRQDYDGQFTTPAGAVYPGMAACLVDMPSGGLPAGRYFGAIDWGSTTDPTAALVGVLDSDDCLWLFWEKYSREDILHTFHSLKDWHNAFYRATDTTVERWWCDHRPDAIKGLRRYRLSNDDNLPKINARKANKGAGTIEYGIDLVTARIRTGKLKIIRGPVQRLIEEADGYRYDVNEDGEGGRLTGADHALDALRYLVLGIDRRKTFVG